MALAVHRHRETGGLPGHQRAQGRVGVHRVALDQLRLVGDAVGVGVEAEAGDAHVGRAVHLGHVHQALPAGHGHLGGLRGVARHAEHASQVVPAPARHQRQRRVAVAQGTDQRAEQAVPSERRHGLPALGGQARLLLGVIEAAGGDRAVLGSVAIHHRDHFRKRGERAPARRCRVHEQREAADWVVRCSPAHGRAPLLPAHSAAAVLAARSAAIAPRSSPRRWAPPSRRCTSARATAASPTRRSA